MDNKQLNKRKSKFWIDLLNAKAGSTHISIQKKRSNTKNNLLKQNDRKVLHINSHIITGTDLMSIKGFNSLAQVENFFVKHGIRPFYSPNGHPFVTVEILTEAQRTKLEFTDEIT